MKRINQRKLREFRFQLSIELIMIVLLLMAYIAFLLTLFMSTTSN